MAEGVGQAAAIQGHVDTVSRFEVRGWAVDRADPARRLAVELVSNGRTVSLAPVRQERADLAVLAAGRIDLGFTLPVPAGTPLDLETLSVRVAGSGEAMPFGKASAALEGVIDNAFGTRIAGWAWRVGCPDERLLVTISHKGEPVANIAADLHRHDRVEAGIGDGRHAFAVDVRQLPGGHSFDVDDIDVRFEQNGRPLHDLRRQQETSRILPPSPLPAPAPTPPTPPLQPIRRPAPEVQVIDPRPAPSAPAPAAPPAPATAPVSKEVAEALLGSINFGEDDERLGL